MQYEVFFMQNLQNNDLSLKCFNILLFDAFFNRCLAKLLCKMNIVTLEFLKKKNYLFQCDNLIRKIFNDLNKQTTGYLRSGASFA